MFGNARWTRGGGGGNVANEISELHRDNYEDNLAGIKLPAPRAFPNQSCCPAIPKIR